MTKDFAPQLNNETDEYRYRAILVAIKGNQTPDLSADESLDELERLLHTDDGIACGRLVQNLEVAHPTHFIGKGKAEDVRQLAHSEGANCILFDDELSPRQQATLEEFFGDSLTVLDRTALILEIFAHHATTKEGKLQVELAMLEYQLPRLRGMWSHLEKEKLGGGVGARFGTGESQLETDRRLSRKRIGEIKKALTLVRKDRLTQRSSRLSSTTFRVSLVGYTNAGKSSLLNALTGSEVLAYDKLFATLDSTTRKLELPDKRIVTLTDTVGFIHKLPHQLVAAFRSTLDEVQDAQLLLHVVDASSPQREMMIRAVSEVLESIDSHTIPQVLVFNKIDAISQDELEQLKRLYPSALFVSALDGTGFDEILAKITTAANINSEHMEIILPYKEGHLLKMAFEKTSVMSKEYADEGIKLSLLVPVSLVGYFAPYRGPISSDS